MHRHTRLVVLCVLISAGCNALDKPGASGGVKRIVPVDARPVQQALRVLPAISGGTLAVSPDGKYAVAADPDRDRISVVALAGGNEVRHLMLDQGDEPGRVVIDPNGRAYVALRRAGDLVSLDLASGELLQRTHVCSAPRGVAYDVATDQLHVACADGRLVSLSASDNQIIRKIDLGTDLRDVMVRGDGLIVSTFKAAGLLSVDAAGSVTGRTQPQQLELSVVRQANINLPPTESIQPMQAQLAWRTAQSGDGASGVMMLHQHEATSEIKVDPHPSASDMQASDMGSSYGGQANGLSCAGVVTSSLTRIAIDGTTQTVALGGTTLAVDMAISPFDGTIAIAQAGVADPDAPRPFTVFEGNGGPNGIASAGTAPVALGPGGIPTGFPGGTGRILRLAASSMQPSVGGPPVKDPNSNCQSPEIVPIPGQATAVAYLHDGALVAQTREPAMLVLIPPFGPSSTVDLGGESVRDTGHDLFHRDSGAGIACASCHGEGAEDGHTWVFSNVGARRTQAVHIGLKGTAPFHWNGDMPDVAALMENVFVGRMGGTHQSDERIGALSHFLFALRPPTPIVDSGDAAAVRGKALFASSDVGCASCHQGDKLTNNKSYDVGTGKAGERLQVPSLRGVGYRAPFIHTGCAETLSQRFDPSCGGANHGHTSQLDQQQVGDLIAYLRSL